MAITITSSPAELVAGLRPVAFTATSDRESALTYVNTALASTTGAAGGYTRYTVANTLKVDDIITGSGFSTTSYADFNTRQRVRAVNAAYFDTDLIWVNNADINLIGTITRTNDDFKIKCEVKINGTILDTPVYRVSFNNVFTFNIAKFLTSYLNYKILAIGSSVVIQGTLPNNMITFVVRLNEYWNNVD